MKGDVKVIHDKPRHMYSLGSVERANCNVENILATWMAEKYSKDRPSGIKCVKLRKKSGFLFKFGKYIFQKCKLNVTRK